MTLDALVLLSALCAALAVPFVVLALAPASRVRSRVNARIHVGTSGQGGVGASTNSSNALAKSAKRLTPPAALRILDRWHAAAGRPSAWPLDRVLAGKVILGAVGAALGLLLVSARPSPRTLVIAFALVALMWFLPDLLLLNAGIKRKDTIERQLPDILDQLSIAVEAGLGFEGALSHVAHHSQGPLPEEIIRTLQDMRVGVPRREAYQDMAQRTGVVDLRRFVRAIVQAEQRGVSVARVLHVQAAEMRLKRSQRAEESAMQIPVKVIFPLMFCILPALFVVILGPAVINIIETFPR